MTSKSHEPEVTSERVKGAALVVLDGVEILARMLDRFEGYDRGEGEDAKAFVSRCHRKDAEFTEQITDLSNIAVDYIRDQMNESLVYNEHRMPPTSDKAQ